MAKQKSLKFSAISLLTIFMWTSSPVAQASTSGSSSTHTAVKYDRWQAGNHSLGLGLSVSDVYLVGGEVLFTVHWW